MTSTAAVLLAPRDGDDLWEYPVFRGGGVGLVAHALRREAAVLRALTGRSRRARVHRLRGAGRGLRSALAAGAVLDTAAGSGGRLLDEVVAAAELVAPLGRLHPVAGGGVVATAVDDIGPVLLRVGGPSAPDPRAAAAALEPLVGRGLPVPEPRREGNVGDLRWTTEVRLDGQRPRRLTGRVLDDVVGVLAELATAGAGPPASVLDDLDTLGRLLPDRAQAAAAVRARLDHRAAAATGTFRHGDLWLGNLLVHRGRLRGVVDWDAAHPRGVPGADLLQLVVTTDRHRRKLALGAAWLEQPWRTSQWLDATNGYWALTGIDPAPDLLDLAAVAWWAAEVVGTMSRHPHRARDTRWLGQNVDPVLDALVAGAAGGPITSSEATRRRRRGS